MVATFKDSGQSIAGVTGIVHSSIEILHRHDLVILIGSRFRGENKTLFFKGNGRDDAFIDGRLLPLSVILKSIDAPEDFTWVKEQLQKMPKEDLMRVADFLSSIEPIPQEKGKPAPQQ